MYLAQNLLFRQEQFDSQYRGADKITFNTRRKPLESENLILQKQTRLPSKAVKPLRGGLPLKDVKTPVILLHFSPKQI